MEDLLEFPLLFSGPERLSGFSAWTQHIPFAMTAVKLLRPRTFVELGTHGGDSYCAFCRAVQELRTGTKCYAVDTWQGDEHATFYGPEVLGALRAYHDPRYGRFSELLQMRFNDARDRFADGSIDLLHIDGLHTYEAVRNDFETWLPAMSDRGVILFHDTQVRERDFAVWKLWEEIAPRYKHCEFLFGHGLGVLAVGKLVPEAFLSLLREANERAVVAEMFEALGLRWSLTQALANCRRDLENTLAANASMRAQTAPLARRLTPFLSLPSRLIARLNRRAGPIHRWTKEPLNLAAELVRRWRRSAASPAPINDADSAGQELPDVLPMRPFDASDSRQAKRAA